MLIASACADESRSTGPADGDLSDAISTCLDYGSSQGLHDEALTVATATTLGDIRASPAVDGSTLTLPEPWASQADDTTVARCSFTLPSPSEVTPTTVCPDGSTDVVDATPAARQVLVDDEGTLIAEEPLPTRTPCGT